MYRQPDYVTGAADGNEDDENDVGHDDKMILIVIQVKG